MMDVAFKIMPPGRGYLTNFHIKVTLSGFDSYDSQRGVLTLRVKGLTYKFPYEIWTLDRESDHEIRVTLFANSFGESFDMEDKVEAFIDGINEAS